MGKNQSLNLPYPLILASTSKYRRELLMKLGWPFESIAPGVDENKIKMTGLSPVELVKELSKLKAEAVFAQHGNSCVIGSDQICTLDGKIFDKTENFDKASEQLLLLQGHKHELLTSVTVLYPGGHKTFMNKTTLHMRPLSLLQIQNYLNVDRPFDCAGSYKLEERGISLFHKIEMNDHTAIIGLPLIELSNVLIELGYTL